MNKAKKPVPITPARAKAVVRLNRSLHAVRADLDTCIEQFRLRMAARLHDAIRIFNGGGPGEEKHPLPPLAALKVAATIVKRMKFKPRKGRAKDLKHMDNLVAELLHHLIVETPSPEDRP